MAKKNNIASIASIAKIAEIAEFDDKRKAIIASITNGACNADAYRAAEVPEKTFYNWMHDDLFRSAVDTARLAGRNIRIRNVEDALYSTAIDGNTTAQIFFLKNRLSKEWADKHEIQGGADKTVINVITSSPSKAKPTAIEEGRLKL